jgi:hypothetical protein
MLLDRKKLRKFNAERKNVVFPSQLAPSRIVPGIKTMFAGDPLSFRPDAISTKNNITRVPIGRFET